VFRGENMNAKEIGKNFHEEILNFVGPWNMHKMAGIQQEYDENDPMACASHEFCNSNEIMKDVMEECGYPMPDIEDTQANETWTSLVNEAWLEMKRINAELREKTIMEQISKKNGTWTSLVNEAWLEMKRINAELREKTIMEQISKKNV
jgi:hypothetical protein